MNRTSFIVQSIALGAQGVRDASGRQLINAHIRPGALLRQLEQAFTCAQLVFESHPVTLLRECFEAECPDGLLNAALVLYDVCIALELDEPAIQCALSLADWSDIQRALASHIELQEVVIMSP